jgi:hypothetical protein
MQSWPLVALSFADTELAFYEYFRSQNALVGQGKVEGIQLQLKTLGILSGIIDGAIQFPRVSVI